MTDNELVTLEEAVSIIWNNQEILNKGLNKLMRIEKRRKFVKGALIVAVGYCAWCYYKEMKKEEIKEN